jgi:hypothetical protein
VIKKLLIRPDREFLQGDATDATGDGGEIR